MDIDLLSKMVKELILDNERVVLPGLGSFVAEIVPASFSDKGYTINPPYRKLYFRSKPDEGSDLIPFYANNNSVSEDVAEKVITDFVSELKAILFHKKTVIFPGLGRLRATKENNVFFVADEDLDIYPEGFGLEPISLKTHDASSAEVKAVVSDLKSILTESEPPVAVVEETVMVETPNEQPAVDVVEETVVDSVEEPVVEVVSEEPVVEEVAVEVSDEAAEAVSEEPVEEELPVAELAEEVEVETDAVVEDVENEVVAEEVEQPAEAPVRKSFWKIILKAIMWLAISVAVLMAAYVAVAHLCPQWIDQFLYTPEELELLNNR